MNILVYIIFYFIFLFRGKGEHIDQTPAMGQEGTRCYDDFNRPQRCIPEFENAAFNVLMDVTNTCGDHGQMEYCVQTGVTGARKSCEICYPDQHNARYLTDFHQQENPTWWQSETMQEGIQWPNQVNLTLKFGKAFDITYVRLWFWSPRPESFYISKKTTENGPWIPYQHYSATCRDTYGLPDNIYTMRGEETRALCTSEYSDISPLRGGNVAFGTLEGRPSAYNFDGSPELQEWVTSTSIMITLDRMNTFGDEVFEDQQVLQSYFYAIADVAVGARCKCNGHASECTSLRGDNTNRRICKCEHNTAGPDCNECLPFYNDLPWARANAKDAHECKECNCNGYSDRCYFDQKLYEQTGHGGHCLDCTANRDGSNCEVCHENYYMRDDGYCIPCSCDQTGSQTLQCNIEGKCQCKPGVTGKKCDKCSLNHFEFTTYGCKSCGCSEAGSVNNEPHCDPHTGTCYCKENVEGKRCTECKPGFFFLSANNSFGCTPCFCYGHSSQCKSAPGYSKYTLESRFRQNSEKWTAENTLGATHQVKYDSFTQSIGVRSVDTEDVYFIAPDRFLGDQRASYNQFLEFSLRIGDNKPTPTATDIILEGGRNSVTNTIFAQQNRMPTMQNQKYSFRIHENSNYGWQPRLTFKEFFSILTNLTAIKIKGTYGPRSGGYLDNFKLEGAIRAGLPTEPALWIESCDCPPGYIGQFCESCAVGYRHLPGLGGTFMSCVPCDCNNHADICDYETGRCFCHHHTTGDNCELCAKGYYGNALEGTPDDCLPCNCPGSGACVQVDEDTVLCTECPKGYTGHRCDSCSDGYYGDPTGKLGPTIPCKPCECNMNTDPNAIGNCNTTTGVCLKCIYNTGGSQCGTCLPGYYGNALVLPKGDCKSCQCYPPGTEKDTSEVSACDQITGFCHCKPHVVGRNCDKCENTYYNIHSAEGCQSCNCNPIGSLNRTCDIFSGQCYCRPGVTGPRCDHCEARKYGFSYEGCKDCNCDITGSRDMQCDPSGRCPCLDHVEGEKCDRCKENKYDRQRGCVTCPDCYGIVQNAAQSHNNKLTKLNEILDDIEHQPIVISDYNFPLELKKTETGITEFHEKVVNAKGDHSLLQQVISIREREKDISRTISEIDENIFLINDRNYRTEQNIFHAETILDEASHKMNELNNTFGYRSQKALADAKERAKVAGQHSAKMTELAHEARDLAESLYTTSIAIITNAKDAKNKSIEAYNEAKKANQKLFEIEEVIMDFKRDVLNINLKFEKSKKLTKEVTERAVTVKNGALTLLNEVKNLNIPQIDVTELKEKTNDLKLEALKLRNKTIDLFYNSNKLKKYIDEQNYMGRELLEKAHEQQDEINKINNDLVLSKSQANEAINLWNDILESAETNYQLLIDFDTETQKSRAEADAALKTVSEIEAVLKSITDKAIDSQNSLEDAKKNANLALKKAIQADTMARDASQEVEYIEKEARVLYKNTTALGEETELMFDRVQNTEGEYKNLVEKTKNNNTLINEAKEKVGRAAKDTKEASRRVSDFLNDVQNIMAELQNSPEINDNEIDRLEEQIRITEESIKREKLDEKLEVLRKEQKEQDNLIVKYKYQIHILQREVEGIEQMVKALPDGCFRRVELEP